MLMPSIFSNDFMDDFFNVPRITGFGGSRFDREFSRMMTTDVKETDTGYELDMNLPGFAKEDIKAELKDGYLTIKAESNTSNDEKDKDGNFIRRERRFGSYSRSSDVTGIDTEKKRISLSMRAVAAEDEAPAEEADEVVYSDEAPAEAPA
mgnify:CR=1 FL=1